MVVSGKTSDVCHSMDSMDIVDSDSSSDDGDFNDWDRYDIVEDDDRVLRPKRSELDKYDVDSADKYDVDSALNRTGNRVGYVAGSGHQTIFAGSGHQTIFGNNFGMIEDRDQRVHTGIGLGATPGGVLTPAGDFAAIRPSIVGGKFCGSFAPHSKYSQQLEGLAELPRPVQFPLTMGVFSNQNSGNLMFREGRELHLNDPQFNSIENPWNDGSETCSSRSHRTYSETSCDQQLERNQTNHNKTQQDHPENKEKILEYNELLTRMTSSVTNPENTMQISEKLHKIMSDLINKQPIKTGVSDPIHYKSEHAKNLALYLKNTVTWADMSQIFGAMDSLKQMFAEFRTQHTAGMSFTDCALSHLNTASGKSSSKSKDDLLVGTKVKKSNDDSLERIKVKNSRDNLSVREKVHSEREKRERKRSREREKSRICSTHRTKTSGDSSRKRETLSSKNDSRRKRSPSPKRSHRRNSSSKSRETRSKSKESSRATVRRIRSLDKTHSRSTRDPLSRSYFYRCSVSRSHPRPIVLPSLPMRKPLLSEEFAAKIDAKCMQQSVYCPEFSKGLDDDNNNFSQSTKTVWSPTRQSRPSTISPKIEKGEMTHMKSMETSREISFKETRNESRIPARSDLVVLCAERDCSDMLSDQTRTSVPSLLSLKFGNNFF